MAAKYILAPVGSPSAALSANPAYADELTAPVWVDSRFGDREATITWGLCPGASGYRIFRASGFSGDYSPIARTSKALIFRDTGLKNGVVYRYRVSALHGDSWTALSDGVGVIPNEVQVKAVAAKASIGTKTAN